MHNRYFVAISCIAIGVAALGVRTARAQTVEEFYKNHPITLVVSSGAGGGYDVYSRLLARFLPQNIPGNPRIVVQNMAGADGLNAINYMNNVAPRDGSVIADTYSTMPFYMLLDGRNAKFDPARINWLGNISKALSVCIAWGVGSFKTIDDAMTRNMRVAGTGALGWRSVLPRLYNQVAGTKFEVVTGYATNEDYMAVERGEVDGSCTTYDTILASKNDWITRKQVTFLAQFGDKATPELPNVPLALDRIKNREDRAAMDIILSQQQTGRPYLAPPGVPADRVQALRLAFDATMKDNEFLAAARQGNLWIAPMEAGPMETLIRNAYAAPPAIIERARSLLEKALPK
jgi:tripartite-type tricarboxylate transporter receptor subunit TctC